MALASGFAVDGRVDLYDDIEMAQPPGSAAMGYDFKVTTYAADAVDEDGDED
jgi:hypothetical protein